VAAISPSVGAEERAFRSTIATVAVARELTGFSDPRRPSRPASKWQSHVPVEGRAQEQVVVSGARAAAREREQSAMSAFWQNAAKGC
jgi:hypothetical protein